MLLVSSQKICKKNLHFSYTGCNIRYTVSLVCIDNLRRFIPQNPFDLPPETVLNKRAGHIPRLFFYFFFGAKKKTKNLLVEPY